MDNDTDPAVESRFYRLIMAKTPEERLLMGCSMFDAAKEIVKGAFSDQNPAITPKELREGFFLRFYGGEFNRTQQRKILKFLRQS